MQISLNEAADWLKAQQDVLLLCHQSPDGDCLGSGAALCLALQKLGKRARVDCCDPVPPRFAFLFETVAAQDFVPQTVVSLDVADEKLLGALQAQYGGRVQLSVDHHPSNTRYAQKNYVQPSASATCEILAELLPLMGVPMDLPIATALYTGICTDTGCFQYINVTPHTLRTAAALLDKGVPAAQINHAMFATKSRALLRLQCAAMQALRFYHDGEIAVIPLSLDMLHASGATDDDTDAIAAIPRSVEGVRLGVTLKEKGPALVKVSLRAEQPISAAEICSQFGGGGHPGAAGCALACGLAEAEKRFVEVAQQYLEGKK